MSTQVEISNAKLTPHEAEQVREIAAWKSQPPNPLDELSKTVTLPWARFLERIVPDWIVTTTINRSYDLARALASPDATKRKAGVEQLAELRQWPLEECDRLARRVAASARLISLFEGGVTGAGGVVTTVLDIPLLFVLSLRTIQKIGHCYGYALDSEGDRQYVLGVLITATSGSLDSKRERLDRLHGLKDWFFEMTQEEIVADELLSLLFQLEVFEEIPGIGIVSGAALNLFFSRKIDVTARRVFQERWLRDNGKVAGIEPAPAPRHV
ncbi:MAG TPA: EcsC family protein, partial [Isosphaeraceae bacterium]|nr:EcsC family protein [Isosphaeraceae bacterium]